MKTKNILFTIIIAVQFYSYSQKVEQIDFNSNILILEKSIKPDNYIFKLTNLNISNTYEVLATLDDINITQLNLPNDDDNAKLFFAPVNVDQKIGEFEISKGQKLVITITEKTSGTNPTERKIIRNYTTGVKGRWQTTFGFNFVKLNDKTFFSSQNEDMSYQITKSNNEKEWEYYPSIMFTWLKNGSNEVKFGFSGGLGYDLDNSISVFTGGSIIYNHNITITAGVAFHNQKELNSKYKEGDTISENLEFDQLHTDFIAVNPFISISLRLDRNPFKRE